MNRVETYEHLKNQVIAYTTALPPSVRSSQCEPCPAWSLQDVIAHHIHAQLCRLEDDFPPAALTAITAADESDRAEAQVIRDAWTDKGVAQRRSRTLEELSEEWDVIIAQLDESMPLILDLTVHFDDIRETVEGHTPRNGRDTMIALRQFHRIQAMKLGAKGLQSVSLLSTDDDEFLSRSERSATVSGTTYDLLRCLTSRRDRATAERILDWGDLATEVRDAFPVYGWPTRQGQWKPTA